MIMTMQEDINNNLYKKKKRTINWRETINDFGNKYEGTCFILIVLAVVSIGWTVVYFAEHNPWYLLYIAIVCIFIWLITVVLKFLKCIKYNE